MTDYFALLEQPTLPWLDPEQVKEAFHRATLRSHPDAAAGATAGDFPQVNEAYQVLREPKLRLQHLLTLAGTPPARSSGSIPRDVEELFPGVATLTQEAAELTEKYAGASNALTRSLLKTQMLQTQQRLAEMLQLLDLRQADSIARLQQLNGAWEENRQAVLSELQELYLRFSYLGRWTAELRERELQLRA